MSAGRLVFVALRVRDLDASVRFYRDGIGIPLEPSDQPDAEPHAEYSWREGAYLHFALFPARAGDAGGRGWIGFTVDDADAALARAVAAGGEAVQEPAHEPWGRTAVCADPDGNTVALTER